MASESGWRFVQQYTKHFRITHVVLWHDSSTGQFLRIDLITDLGIGPFKWLDGRGVLRRRQRKGVIFVPSAGDEAAITVATGILGSGLKEKYLGGLSELIRSDPARFESALKVFGPLVSSRFVGEISPGSWEKSGSIRPIAYRRLMFANLRSPWQLMLQMIEFIRLTARRVLHPTGLFLVFVGPDGSGKTTLGRRLVDENPALFSLRRYFHFRASVLPFLRSLPVLRERERPGHDVNEGTKPGVTSSLARLMYYGADFYLGYFFRILPILIRGGLVVCDRYVYDYVVDPRKKNIVFRPGSLKRLVNMLPQPHAVIVADCDSTLMIERKGELDFAEAERQREGFSSLELRTPVRRVSTSESISDSSREVCGLVAELLSNRRASV